MQIWQELLFFAIVLGSGIWAWWRTRQAASWPSTQGTVLQAVARRSTDRRYKTWAGEFVYNYLVNGEYYAGRHQVRVWSERRAERLVEGWKDRMIVVRYSPAQPGLSVLLRSDQPGGQLGNPN